MASSGSNMDANLRTSLAMLDFQLASLHELGPLSPRMSAALEAVERAGGFKGAPNAGAFGDLEWDGVEEEEEEEQEEEELRTVSPVEQASIEKTRSPSRASVLWDALGLEPESVAAETVAPRIRMETTHSGTMSLPSADSMVSISSSQISNGYMDRLRARLAKADTYPSSDSADEFDTSEYPSYSDLAAFAADNNRNSVMHAVTAVNQGRRSSNLLEFPVPPEAPLSAPSAPPTNRSSEQPSLIEFDDDASPVTNEGDFTREEAGVFDELERLGAGCVGAGQGLGLFDSSAAASPAPAPYDFGSGSANASSLDFEIRSDDGEEGDTTTASASTHDLSSADTSFVISPASLASSSKEDVLTSVPAFAATRPPPTRSASLPPLPSLPLPPPIRSPLKLDTSRATTGLRLPNNGSAFTESLSSPTLTPTSTVFPVTTASASSSRCSSPTSVSDRNARIDVYRSSTIALGLDGDNGMPLWTPSPESSPSRKMAEKSRTRARSRSPASATRARSPLVSTQAPPATPALAKESAAGASAGPPRPSMAKRLSTSTLGLLKKRKSEVALSSLAQQQQQPTQANTKPGLTKRSMSSPRLSAMFSRHAQVASPPLPTSSTLSSYSTGSRKHSSISSAVPRLPTSGLPRLNIMASPSVSHDRGLAVPLSAPPSTTTFADAQANLLQQQHQQPSHGPAQRQRSPTTTTPGFFDFANAGSTYSMGGLASPVHLSAGSGSPWQDQPRAHSSNSDESEHLSLEGFMRTTTPTMSASPVPSLASSGNGRFSPSLHSQADLVQRPVRKSSFFGPGSSPIFPQTQPKQVCAASPRAPFSDSTNSAQRCLSPPSPALSFSSTKKSDDTRDHKAWSDISPVLKQEAAAFATVDSRDNDIVAFPMTMGFGQPGGLEISLPMQAPSMPASMAMSVLPPTPVSATREVGTVAATWKDDSDSADDQVEELTSAAAALGYDESGDGGDGEGSSDSDDDEDDDEDGDGDDDATDDDKPLGAIPGALSAQKSLRQESRKASKKKAAVAAESHRKSSNVNSRRRHPTSPSRDLGIESIGHSLLPHTDDAVRRRSESVTRSPSMPLDPIIANSALTMDSPEVPLPRPLRPAPNRAATMPSSGPSSREPSPRRPSLGINVSVSRLVSTSSAQRSPRSPAGSPGPSSRRPSDSSQRPASSPSSSAAPSRRPSQMSIASVHRSDAAGRHRSDTNASSASGHHGLTPAAAVAIQRNLSSKSSRGSLKASTSRSSPSGSPQIPPPPPPLPTTEQRIFIGDETKQIQVDVSVITTAVDVVNTARRAGALQFGTDSEGGFALWEISRALGVERPIREYEFISDVLKSWEHENILLVKRTPLWPLLSAHLRTQPSVTRSAFVQLEMKKGKWSKRFLEVKDGVVTHAKSEKNKDATSLCQLANFEVFFVSRQMSDQLKAPKPCVFALKSKLPRAHYEKEEEFCYFLSVKTAEELSLWVRTLIEARNPIIRKQNAVALSGSPHVSSQPTMPSRTLLADGELQPASSSSLARKPTGHAVPAVLATPTQSPNIDSQSRDTPGALVRPDARQWAGMAEQDKQRWLKEAQREAKEQGKTLVDLR